MIASGTRVVSQKPTRSAATTTPHTTRKYAFARVRWATKPRTRCVRALLVVAAHTHTQTDLYATNMSSHARAIAVHLRAAGASTRRRRCACTQPKRCGGGSDDDDGHDDNNPTNKSTHRAVDDDDDYDKIMRVRAVLCLEFRPSARVSYAEMTRRRRIKGSVLWCVWVHYDDVQWFRKCIYVCLNNVITRTQICVYTIYCR